MVVGGEGRNVGHLHLHMLAAALQISGQVAGHADVRRGVDAVGRETIPIR